MKVNRIIRNFFKGSPKPILSLTTIPTRLVSDYGYDIKYCLESLLNQNYNDYEIHFNIPYVFKKTNVDAALAASVFHFKDIEILKLKKYLLNNNIDIRM